MRARWFAWPSGTQHRHCDRTSPRTLHGALYDTQLEPQQNRNSSLTSRQTVPQAEDEVPWTCSKRGHAHHLRIWSVWGPTDDKLLSPRGLTPTCWRSTGRRSARRLGIAWSTIASCCSAIGPFLWTNGVSSLNRWYSASSFTEQRPGLWRKKALLVISTLRAIRLYRRLLPAPAGQHLADVEIMSKVGLPSPIDLLRPYFIVETGKGLLACDAWWTSLIEEDMAWMWQQVRNSSHLLDPRQHWAACKEHILLHHRSYWRRLIRRACGHSIPQKFTQFCRDLYDYVPHHKVLPDKSRQTSLLGAYSVGADAKVVQVKLLTCFASIDEECWSIRSIARHASRSTAPWRSSKRTSTMPATAASPLLSRNYACQSVPGAGSPDSYTTFTSRRATPTTTTSWWRHRGWHGPAHELHGDLPGRWGCWRRSSDDPGKAWD